MMVLPAGSEEARGKEWRGRQTWCLESCGQFGGRSSARRGSNVRTKLSAEGNSSQSSETNTPSHHLLISKSTACSLYRLTRRPAGIPLTLWLASLKITYAKEHQIAHRHRTYFSGQIPAVWPALNARGAAWIH